MDLLLIFLKVWMSPQKYPLKLFLFFGDSGYDSGRLITLAGYRVRERIHKTAYIQISRHETLSTRSL